MVGAGEGWALPGLLAQDTLCINEHLFGSQVRYMKGTGQVLRCAVSFVL